MARKKASKKTAAKKGTQAQLPKGFTAISSGFSKSWPSEETKIGDAIEGVVTEYRDVPRPKAKGGDTQVMSIEQEDGTTVSVWKSAVLTPFFDEDYEGVRVWIRFDGHGKKKKGQNPVKLFTFAYEE
jgi:hypothetical protein